MIPSVTNRLVTSGGVSASAPFGISDGDVAHIMGILREGLYSDRIAALLREYSANAWDAHMEAGIGLIPILVHVPMHHDPNLRIRDFGPGLSPEEVFTVYNQYGRSSKRGSNLAVGQLGIGSKSAFCYADSFTITSYHGGYKRIYAAVIDASNLGRIDLLYEEASTETGVEIQIAAKVSDVSEFHTKARTLFKHFPVRPDINLDLPSPPSRLAELQHGNLCSSAEGTGWLAIMGCVPYRVNILQIDTTLVGNHIHKLGGELRFAIGEVEMSANREELKYTDATKAAIVAKINDLVDEYVAETMNLIEAGGFTPWEKRLRAQVLSQLELPIPKHWKDYAEDSIRIDYQGMNFTLIHHRSVTTRITISPSTRILIDDTGKDLGGYNLSYTDWVMRPEAGATVADARQNLEIALEIAGLTGVNIQLLSTIPYIPPYKKPPKTVNPKHKVRVFKLIRDAARVHPWSGSWVACTHAPLLDDVFVVTYNFKAHDYKEFFAHYNADSNLVKQLGGEMPVVYGYKSTAKKPLAEAMITGTPYQTWRKSLGPTLLTPEAIEVIESLHWSRLGSAESFTQPSHGTVDGLARVLGNDHLIVRVLRDMITGSSQIFKMGQSKKDAYATLANLTQRTYATSTAKHTLVEVYDAYPLLRLHTVVALWDYKHSKLWTDYVETLDCMRRLERLASAPPPSPVHQTHIADSLDAPWF